MNTPKSPMLPIDLDFHMDLEKEGYLVTTIKSNLVTQPSNSTNNLSSVTFTPVFTLPSSKKYQSTGKDIHFSHHFYLVMWKNSVVALCLCSEQDGDRDHDYKLYKLCTIFDNSCDELNQIAGFVVHHNKTVVALFKACLQYDDGIWNGLGVFIISHIFNPNLLGNFINFIYDE
ncbi:hypothetical protein [Acinetobacter rudis]|uniref:Uncharacterized protein n=1 Tax=Acinetobacter rudis TaxID=632955 RepID=A0AAW8JEU7_9GAMM|nr:hypothetical protein [Acinetobacter rudis]MDQ8937120.1 hypothetical protein [Acinetobacter rudis]MDQ9019337.1 hypothetical protein [Acinetobacter rudis]